MASWYLMPWRMIIGLGHEPKNICRRGGLSLFLQKPCSGMVTICTFIWNNRTNPHIHTYTLSSVNDNAAELDGSQLNRRVRVCFNFLTEIRNDNKLMKNIVSQRPHFPMTIFCLFNIPLTILVVFASYTFAPSHVIFFHRYNQCIISQFDLISKHMKFIKSSWKIQKKYKNWLDDPNHLTDMGISQQRNDGSSWNCFLRRSHTRLISISQRRAISNDFTAFMWRE